MWTPSELSPRGPVYQAIADALARDLEAGRLSEGERLPTHRDLARRLGVNVVTVTRAYAEAKRRGLVEGEVGRGTFVRRGEVGPPRRAPLRQDEDGRIDLHFNLPACDPDWVDAPGLLAGLAAEGFDPLRAHYVPAGQRRHREAAARWFSRDGFQADPARSLITSGGQHALSVALTTLTGPGDSMLTAELSYPGIRSLTSLLHLSTVALPMDADGILPDAFEQACRRGNPRVLYCMPTLQNPTGLVWPEARRREILEVAERWGVLVLEDDTTSFAVEDAPPPLAALAPERVVFASSTSKSLGPGLRIGFLHLPSEGGLGEASHERASASLAATSWMTPPLMAELATRLVESGQAERVVRAKRREIEVRRGLFEERFGASASASHPRSSFVWMPLAEPWRSSDVVEAARQRGVAITAAEDFVMGRAPAPHAVRLCLATPLQRELLERALDVVADVLASAPGGRRALV